jgi:hypothetical protein
VSTKVSDETGATQALTDSPVGEPFGEQRENLPLTGSQSVEPARPIVVVH